MRYIIQTLQSDSQWLETGTARGKAKAIAHADADYAQWLAPKRVVDTKSGAVLHTVGDTPEYRAMLARAQATIAAEDAAKARAGLTRAEYRRARALIRANGTHAYAWIPAHAADVFRALEDQGNDNLRIRARLERNAKTRILLWPVGARTDALCQTIKNGRAFAQWRAAQYGF